MVSSYEMKVADVSQDFITCVSMCGLNSNCVPVEGQRTFYSWFSVHHVGPEDQTQVAKLGGRHL